MAVRGVAADQQPFMTIDVGEVLAYAVEVAKAAGAEIVKGSETRLASAGA